MLYVINKGIQQTKVENGVVWFIGVGGLIDSTYQYHPNQPKHTKLSTPAVFSNM